MAEKIYSFTHSISETKLLALISANADDVQINIFVPEKKTRPKQLTNGHANVSPLMLEPPKEQEHKPPGRQPGVKTSGSVVALQYLADHRTRVVSNTELNEHVEKAGHSVGAVSVAMSGFVKKGLAERVSSGHYKILKEGIERLKQIKKLGYSTGGKRAKAPETIDTTDIPEAGEEFFKNAKLKKPKQKGIKHPGVGRGNAPANGGIGRAMVWAELVKGERVTPKQFRQPLKDAGMSPTSVTSTLAYYMSKGFVTKIEPGVYQITQQGKDHHAAKSN